MERRLLSPWKTVKNLLDKAVLNHVDHQNDDHEGDADSKSHSGDDVVKRCLALKRGADSTATAHGVTLSSNQNQKAVDNGQKGGQNETDLYKNCHGKS